MIRHRPCGSGHPYRLEPDQRVPACRWRRAARAAGSPATTSRWSASRAPTARHRQMRCRVRRRRRYAARTQRRSDGGHLSAAAARPGSAGRRPAGRSTLARSPAAERLSGTGFAGRRRDSHTRTGWFDVRRRRGGRPAARSSARRTDRLVPGQRAWLADRRRVQRVRFALRLGRRRARGRVRRALRRARPARATRSTRSCSSSTRARAPAHVPADAVRARRRRRRLGLPRRHVPADLVRRRRVRRDLLVDRGGASTGRRAPRRAASTTAHPTDVLARSSTRSAGRRSCPTGCSGCGPAATSGTPRQRSCAEMDAAPRARHPGRRRGDRGVERRVDVHRVPRRAVRGARRTAARTASPTSPSRRTAPGPTRRAWSTSCTHAGRQGAALADPAA